MTKDEIMRLADAYADAQQAQPRFTARVQEARAALEAAIVNQQLTVEQEPVAQGEPCGWFDPQTGDYSRVNRIGWSEMYLRPAPVNTALLEALKVSLEAMEYADACLKKQLTTKTKHEYAQDLLMGAGTTARAAIAAAERTTK